jgi:hypothetical protein
MTPKPLAPSSSKNVYALTSFVEYCKAHPQERFWQALRNWSGYSFVLGVEDCSWQDNVSIGKCDTFYKEGK